jgi:2-dehydropantoate 2-reductase
VHVCVLGAGGLGCVIGARLAESGVDVTLIARAAHVDAINLSGLAVSGAGGDRAVRDHVRAVVDPSDVDGSIDCLMLLVKTRDTASALSSANGLADRVDVALSLQNAATKDDALIDWLGAPRVVGAATTEAGTMVGPGAVRHVSTSPTSQFYFGENDGIASDRVATLVDAFTRAGFLAHQTNVIHQVVWEKLLQISTVAGYSASTIGFLPGGSFADGLTVRAGAEHYVQIATELLAIYRALGYEPQDFFAPFSAFRRLASASFDDSVVDALALGEAMRVGGIVGRPSLHEDIVRGKPTEVDDSLGVYLDAAARLDVAAPTARGAYRVIKTLEALGRANP